VSRTRLAPFALAAATLVAATPALAGNGGGNASQVEQLGPKNLLSQSRVGVVGSQAKIRTLSTLTTRTIPITIQALNVEELGPKNLLGR